MSRQQSPGDKTPQEDQNNGGSTSKFGGTLKSASRRAGAGVKAVSTKASSGARTALGKAGSGAKTVASKAGSGAKRVGGGAVRVGAGAVSLASSPGKRVKGGMNNLNMRMEAVSWTPKVMMKEYVRFNITGIINTSIFFLIYEFFYWLVLWNDHRAVSAWVVAAIISQIQSHFTHYKYTFNSGAPYLASLKWATIVYTTALAFSTMSEYYLIEIMDIHHRLAWAINALFFGFMNFATLRWLAFPPEHDKSIQSGEE